MVDGEVAARCCDDCLAALFFGGRHPHELIRPEPHWHWPAPGQSVQACGEHESYVTQSAVVSHHDDEAAMHEARQRTHDLLIDGLGELRCSGIWWTHHTGTQAIALVNDLTGVDDPDPRVAEHRASYLEHLNASEHSVLVVAWVLATVPPNGSDG
jgi:hypothetical protein